MYSIQHYVIKADRHDITEILLKVTLNTIILTPLRFKKEST